MSSHGSARRRVAVTRAAVGLGPVLAETLRDQGWDVVDVTDSLPLTGYDARSAELASPTVVEALAGAHVLVHSSAPGDFGAAMREVPSRRRARMVREAQALVTAAAAAGVSHVVVITSAMVFGASADHPVPLPEDTPVATTLGPSLAGDLAEVEDVLTSARHSHPGMRLTSLRPAALAGAGVDSLISRHFEAPRLLTLRGRTPRWQFAHPADVASALGVVLAQQVDGVVTVGCEGYLTQSQLEELAGMRGVELPASSAYAAAAQLHRLGLLPSPPQDLAFVSEPWVVGSQRLRETGWSAAYDNSAALTEMLTSVRGQTTVLARRLTRRDAAAVGAASAAVAIGASAALMRRRRRDT